MHRYQTVYKPAQAEIVEKKSRFIASVSPAKTEEEAICFIESIKKKYWNASHNCYAYSVEIKSELQRCSDDGEPSGTAGKPILEVLSGSKIKNTAIVVTRYFGGTLLGTGGLVRAYCQAAKEGLASSCIITKILGLKLKIETDYKGLGKIQHLLAKKNLKILETIYTEAVEIEVVVPIELVEEIEGAITEGTNAKAKMKRGETCYFAEIEGAIKILTD